ncbi:MAG: NADH-quinone oxidoreductase subunit C [gamma proteobacterium endosymbiont of Lamellibrachia anaximandri]|nr:NADH-quinone oxidoreductase subunit C [gamma proteobacterium endosymbiont of Lamellibrachia anaximandri]MBL3533337.1 NADH-quinone oxidoreductase subunit C [gamma proteobacterium endosymbiont of Lamellibrachia anaximandri]MBL3599174.1 NADH-quinone oxidoreductase subunit C [gamma proteobacterium endosymbiont of Lamellibrachia anaximandri]
MEARMTTLADDLTGRFAELGCEVEQGFGEVTLVVPRDHLLQIGEILRDDEAFHFEEVIDVCGVDYSAYGVAEWDVTTASSTGFARGVESAHAFDLEAEKRFAAVYHLLSVKNNMRLRLRVFVDTTHPIVASVVSIWNCANWFEREAFDLYGILFEGHPDLRRILTDYGFIGHPFRKDFPLIGQVEMRYDPEQARVIYEPVTMEGRTLVPRVIRDNDQNLPEVSEQQDSSDA